MDIIEIQKLVTTGESSKLEFKRTTGQLDRGMESVCAFLNEQGGTLLYGVADDGEICGQVVSDSTKRDIAEHIRLFKPFPLLDIEYIPIADNNGHVTLTFWRNDGELNEGQQRTLHYIAQHEGCTASTIAAETQTPFSTVDKHIRILISKSLIERRGSKRTGGYYLCQH